MNQTAVVQNILTRDVSDRVAQIFGVCAFTALIALGAHVKFFLPANPVPVTLQTFFVLLAGATLGVRAGLSAVAGYIALGVAGVPLFAGAGVAGLAYLAGPTCGYLAGFFLAVVVLSALIKRARSASAVVLSFALASVVILVAGAAYLAFPFGLGIEKALTFGVFPFLIGDAIKTAAAALLFIGLRDHNPLRY